MQLTLAAGCSKGSAKATLERTILGTSRFSVHARYIHNDASNCSRSAGDGRLSNFIMQAIGGPQKPLWSAIA